MSSETTAAFEAEGPTDTDLLEEEPGYRVAEFHAFINRNASVMVESERAPGFKAPLGVLMGMCAAEITEENVDMFYAEAQAMLARAGSETSEIETEETDEEKTEQDELVDKAKNKPDQKPEKRAGEDKPGPKQPPETINSDKNSSAVSQPQTQEAARQETVQTYSPQAKPEQTGDSVGHYVRANHDAGATTTHIIQPKPVETTRTPVPESSPPIVTAEPVLIPAASPETPDWPAAVEAPPRLSRADKNMELETAETRQVFPIESDIEPLEIDKYMY